jgi:Tfp pilus assembly protein PilX
MRINTLRKLLHRPPSRGMSLLIVLVLLAAIVVLAAGGASVVYTDMQVSRNEKLARQATFGSESGLEAVWHDVRYAADTDNDGQIDLVPGVNDLDRNNVVDFYQIYRDGLNLASAPSPVTLSSSPSRLVTVWVEANQPDIGIATIHSTCQIFAEDGATLLARKVMEMEISSLVGFKVRAPVNSAAKCGCCNNPTRPPCLPAP